MTRKDKALIAEKGILSTSNPKLGKRLNDDVLEKVKNFYNSDDVSRLMPGMKDCITVKIDESRMRVQKKLILGNLKEIYQFLNKYIQIFILYFQNLQSFVQRIGL